MILIAGWGQQLIVWPAGFVELMVAAGYRVVRFENRDVGRSSRAPAPAPGRRQLLTRRFSQAQHTLADMSADTAGLLDALEVSAAHVVGMSMGGMIRQTLAAQSPARVLTLTSIMSSTGGWRVGWAAPRPTCAFSDGRRAHVPLRPDRMVVVMRHIGSSGFPAK